MIDTSPLVNGQTNSDGCGFAEVIERKEILVAGVGFEPTTFGL
jgi:hypothetical protein